MHLTFLGANRQVTGSCYLLEVGDLKVLIDCGLFQEPAYEQRNRDDFPFDPASLDAVVLTHAHLDHCGRLPRLVKAGFRGPIHTHHASVELAKLVMADAGRLQQEEAEHLEEHRRAGREGGAAHLRDASPPSPPHEPLYTQADAEAVFPLLQGVGYDTPVQLGEDVAVMLHDAGHILGSAELQLVLRDDGSTHRLVMSGDLGQADRPIIRDPARLRHADTVVLESTYGDRDHEPHGDMEAKLEAVIERTQARGGKLIVPTFAIERAQELLYFIARLRQSKRLSRLPVFLDSPMAIKATELFDDYPSLLDEEAIALLADDKELLDFPELYLCRTRDQSMAINEVDRPAVILAGSGMCTGGRILYHLKRYLGDERNTVMFVGYQGRGTLGRAILDGERSVRVLDREVEVRAHIERLHGMSAHAGRGELLAWLDAFEQPPGRVYLTHGDPDAAEAMRQRIGKLATIPDYQQRVRLGAGT